MTRAARQAEPLAERLVALGYDVVRWPLIEIVSLGDEPLALGGYDWVVVTSPNGADELARRAASAPRRLAAIGPGTAAALGRHGLEPDLVPRVSTQEGLLAELPRAADDRVLVAAAEGARRLLADELGAEFLPLYRTVELVPEAVPDVDLVVLASPSAARALARTACRSPVVAIGPQTAAAARDLGLEVAAEAESHDLDGLAEAAKRLLATR